MEKNQAADLVRARLREYETAGSPPLALLEDRTLTRPFGWVFFYQSRAFIDSGDVGKMLAGNAPIIVDRDTAELHITGTAHPITHYIRDYVEKKRARELASRPRCPGCGVPYDSGTSLTLALTQRQEDGRNVCKAIWKCANCGESWWRWNDRPSEELTPLRDAH